MATLEVRVPNFGKLTDYELRRKLQEVAEEWPDSWDNHTELILEEVLRRIRAVEEEMKQ